MSILFSGCGVHKIEIQQGNVITDDMVKQIKTGMTTQQVQFVLGSPQLIDPFHKDRWDYVYTKSRKGHIIEKKHLILHFEKNVLTKIEEKD